jgi:methionyl-tRNA synthetase
MENKYFTTPIYYVNDKPHIGHAYTSISVDVLKRFYKLRGYGSYFLTGTDEHGQKVEKAALDKGVDPKKFTDQVSENFRALSDILNLDNDDFIRTTEDRHIKSVQNLWNRLLENDEIYLSKYSGWYSVRDEAFVAENEITEKGGKKFNSFGSELTWVEEESYFFRLSKWQDRLLELYDSIPNFVHPKSRLNEVKSFVSGGLKDLSISRTTFKWGIDVPNDDKHIMYVWLDALTNYISALGFPDQESEKYKNFWPGIHVVGKDILRFHAVYWPAFLMAAGLKPPKQIVAHGWWTNEGEKISKSLGNVIDPIELINVYGLDQVRYFLMREVPFGNDGDFSKDAMINRINGDLSNNFGNLMQRVLSFIFKNSNQTIDFTDKILNFDIYQNIISSQNNLFEMMEKYSFDGYLKIIFSHLNDLNIYVDKSAPWELRKTDQVRMKEVLDQISLCILKITQYLAPFIPNGAEKVYSTFGLDGTYLSFDKFEEILEKKSLKISKPEPVFMRIDG